MSRYAGNEEVNRSLCLNCFGIRCLDAILSLQEYTYTDRNSEITIEELKGENKLEIKELYDKLINHLAQKLSGS